MLLLMTFTALFFPYITVVCFPTGHSLRLPSSEYSPANFECKNYGLSKLFTCTLHNLVKNGYVRMIFLTVLFFLDSNIWCQPSAVPGSPAISPGPAHTDKPSN